MTRVYWTEVHTGGLVFEGGLWSRKRDAERTFKSVTAIIASQPHPVERAYLKVREPDGSVQLLESFPQEEGK